MFARYIEIYTTLDMEKYYRVKNTYSISVKKEDEYKARQLIQGRV